MQSKQKHIVINNEKGIVLVVVIMLLAVLVLLGSTALMVTTTDIKISSNYRSGSQAFYIAEAGIEEARARLRIGAANLISDAVPTSTAWQYYIGTAANAAIRGFDSSNGNHTRADSVQSTSSILDYTVQIVHATNSSGQILYWGDSNGDGLGERNTTTGNVIYRVTSFGKSGTSQKTITAEICRVPPITVPGALYVEASTTIHGSSTSILGVDPVTGLDPCGGGAGMPGIASTMGSGTISYNGNPLVNGAGNPSGVPPDAVFNQTNMDIQQMINDLKSNANFKYVTSATQTENNWGTPVLPGGDPSKPSTCLVHNVVYYNTNNTSVKFAGGTSGCGILIVDGDLELNGGFQWNGIVIASGSITFSGGGNKNVTGGVLSGGHVDADLIGGNANIIYCSSAVNDQTQYSPLKKLSWQEVM